MSGAPPPPAAPPGLDLAERSGQSFVPVVSVCFAFAMIAVILRFVARHYSNAGLWLDDWLILPPAAMAIGLVAITPELGVLYGRHVWAVGFPAQEAALSYGFAIEFLYDCLLGTTKLSVLAMYWRIFNISKIRIPILLTAGLVVGWMVSSIIATGLQCEPVLKSTDVIIQGTCLNMKAFFLGNAISNIATDIILLALPMSPIAAMQKALSEKLFFAAIFLCGGLVIVFSGLRLHSLLNVDPTSVDLTWIYTYIFFWSLVEMQGAVFSACLPTLFPLFRLVRDAGNGVSRKSSLATNAADQPGRSLSHAGLRRPLNHDIAEHGHWANTIGTKDSKEYAMDSRGWDTRPDQYPLSTRSSSTWVDSNSRRGPSGRPSIKALGDGRESSRTRTSTLEEHCLV